MRRLLRPCVVAVAVAGLAGCTDTKAIENAAATDDVKLVSASSLPSQILDLTVANETVEGVKTAKRAYVDEVGLFSLRKDELVQATFQVSKFNPKAKPRERSFQLGVINKIGGTAPRRVRMGDQQVWLTTATKQMVAAWFVEDSLYILSVREDYPRPRTLVRAAVELTR